MPCRLQQLLGLECPPICALELTFHTSLISSESPQEGQGVGKLLESAFSEGDLHPNLFRGYLPIYGAMGQTDLDFNPDSGQRYDSFACIFICKMGLAVIASYARRI